jgi:hypothetical protein
VLILMAAVRPLLRRASVLPPVVAEGVRS